MQHRVIFSGLRASAPTMRALPITQWIPTCCSGMQKAAATDGDVRALWLVPPCSSAQCASVHRSTSLPAKIAGVVHAAWTAGRHSLSYIQAAIAVSSFFLCKLMPHTQEMMRELSLSGSLVQH